MRIDELTGLRGPERDRAMAIEVGAFSHPWSMADFDFMVAEPRAINLALRRGDELAGYALALVEGPDLHVVSLAVEEAYRRQGWGTHLVTELLDRAARRGCRSCRLEVRSSNGPARALYRRCGFAPAGVVRGYYTRPTEDALVLSRPIGGPTGPEERSSAHVSPTDTR